MLYSQFASFCTGIVFLFVMSCGGPSTGSEAVTETALAEPQVLSPAFWDYAISSNMLQAELGKLASKKGTSDQIRRWGSEASAYHQKAVQQLKDLGKHKSEIMLPDSLGAADASMVQEFAGLQDKEFDTRYVEHLAVSHKAQLQRYQEAMQKTNDPKLRYLLEDMQQHLRERLKQVAKADSLESGEV